MSTIPSGTEFTGVISIGPGGPFKSETAKRFSIEQIKSEIAYTPVTIGSPANGLSIDGSQVLTIGLASTSATGALSSTDWNTFNAKIGGSIASGQVAFGTGVNTVGGDSLYVYENIAAGRRIGIGTLDPTSPTNDNFNGIQISRTSGNSALVLTTGANSWDVLNLNGTGLYWGYNNSVRFFMTNAGAMGVMTISPTNTLDVNGTARIRTINNLGTAATSVLVPSATGVLSLRTLAELRSDLGVVDQFTVKTTATADQTLPSGTLTILDYDSTLLNNSAATYTVGTDGRITINTAGIYTITAGVVIEANAVTALESAFLGIFRNGDLVAISSINTTIAAGAQSGLSTSTILSLTATDIIDCRALVNSVGGVANGLARRLGTLLGANATQVNSLSITKNSQ